MDAHTISRPFLDRARQNDETPWPYSALAPQGWWLGFDGTPHAAVYAGPQVADELRPEFQRADGWETQVLDRGALLAVADQPIMPPERLVAGLEPHTVPARVRPAGLLGSTQRDGR